MLTGFLVIGVAAVLAVLFWLPWWLFSELMGTGQFRARLN